MTKSPFLSSFVLFFSPSHVRNTSLPSLVCSPCIHSTLFMQNAFYSADVLVHDSPRLHSVLAHTQKNAHTNALPQVYVCVCVFVCLSHSPTQWHYFYISANSMPILELPFVRIWKESVSVFEQKSLHLHSCMLKLFEQIITKASGQTTEIICRVFH